MGGHPVQVAEPEKALLDLWHLQSGEWNLDRMQEMRFQNRGLVSEERLQGYAERFSSPRLLRAVACWVQLGADEEGPVIL